MAKKKQYIKQKKPFNKFNKDLKNGLHKRKQNKKNFKTFLKVHTGVTPSHLPEPVQMAQDTQATERNTSFLHCSSEKVIIC